MRRVIKKSACSHPALGYIKIHQILKRAGFKVSKRTVYYVLKEENLLKIPSWRENTKRFYGDKLSACTPQEPNHLWQMDITCFKPINDAMCYIINVIDYHSNFILASVPAYSFSTQHVKMALEKAFYEAKRFYGPEFDGPFAIVTDNGPSFVSRSFKKFVSSFSGHLRSAYHQPEHIGKVERFHQNLKYEALYPSSPGNILEVRILCDFYRWYHNFWRPHWSQNLKTPAEIYLNKQWDEVRRIAIELQKELGDIRILEEAA